MHYNYTYSTNLRYIILYVRPDQLNKLLHGFARSNFWVNRKKNLIKLGGAYVQ